MSLIRNDEFGTYVITGGYVFRPPVGSKILAGEKVPARHRDGTTTAKVGEEIWESSDWDPRYIENWKKNEPDGFARHVQDTLDIANNNVPKTAPAYNNKAAQEFYRKRYEFLSQFI